MKFNKWTLGLAAIGVVSLASAAKADEKMTALQTALSSTTISGYVDTSIQWNPGTGNGSGAPVAFQGPAKADGFNLNVVQLTIAKPLDEAEWASGYRFDMWFGPDANALGSQSFWSTGGSGASQASTGDFGIRQAYVALRTPVGNGIDWKVGVFDTIIGYESLESGNNPNITRSYGFTMEPTTHTGVLATYRLNDYIAFSGGIANTFGPAINERSHGPYVGGTLNSPTTAESYKTYMGSIALTAPDDWGWASGSTLYLGIINGFSSTTVDTQTHYYLGATVATPVTGLKVGAAVDYLDAHNFPSAGDTMWTVAGYASYQATEKLSLHGRIEYLNGELPGDNAELFALTGTIQYDLWENVISRLEVRWDTSLNGDNVFGGRTLGNGLYEGSDDAEVEQVNGEFPLALDSTPYSSINPLGFTDWHDGTPDGKGGWIDDDEPSTVAGDIFGFSGAPTHDKRENNFLVSLQFIYKF